MFLWGSCGRVLGSHRKNNGGTFTKSLGLTSVYGTSVQIMPTSVPNTVHRSRISAISMPDHSHIYVGSGLHLVRSCLGGILPVHTCRTIKSPPLAKLAPPCTSSKNYISLASTSQGTPIQSANRNEGQNQYVYRTNTVPTHNDVNVGPLRESRLFV